MTGRRGPCVAAAAAAWLNGLLFVGCGASSEAPQESAHDTGGEGRVDACRLLAGADPAAALGGPHDGGRLLWEHHDAGVSVSQCLYTATGGGRDLGLLVKRARQSRPPASREAMIAQTRAEDTMGAGEETAQALEAGRQVPGLGDFAVTYRLISHNLMVWRGEYQLTVMLNGFAGDEAEPRAVAVAESVLAQL